MARRGFDVTFDEAAALRLRDQMQDHLGVGGGLHHRAVADQFAPQRQAVGEVAVMGDGEAAGIQFSEQRLHVTQDGAASGGITDVADGHVAREARNDFSAGEGIADKTETSFGMEAAIVVGDDAGGFLAAMLKGVKPECGDGGGIRVPEDAEHAALFAERVAVKILVQILVEVVVGILGRVARIARGVFHMVHCVRQD